MLKNLVFGAKERISKVIAGDSSVNGEVDPTNATRSSLSEATQLEYYGDFSMQSQRKEITKLLVWMAYRVRS